MVDLAVRATTYFKVLSKDWHEIFSRLRIVRQKERCDCDATGCADVIALLVGEEPETEPAVTLCESSPVALTFFSSPARGLCARVARRNASRCRSRGSGGPSDGRASGATES